MNADQALQSLRVLIQAQITLPALLCVSSATEADNAGRVARGLARAFVEAGKRTLVVETSVQEERERELPFDVVTTVPNREFAGKLDVLRADRDVTIVHAAALLSHPAGLELAGRADGVLIAVRLGRMIRREDELIPNVLEKLGARLLGIVQTSAAEPGPRLDRDVAKRLSYRGLLQP